MTADSETTAGKTGFARLAGVTDDAAEAVAGADVVMITVPAMYHDAFMDAVAPHLRDGQIVLFNTGYWASLRQSCGSAGALPDVTLAESNIMPYICQPRGDAIHIGRFKRHFCVAAFPGERSAAVYDVVRRIYAQYDPATTVLDTNIAAAGNPPIHVTLTIPIAGLYFDRYMGGKFYQDTTIPARGSSRRSTPSVSGSPRISGRSSFEDQVSFDRRSYLYEGEDLVQMLRSSPHADWFATAAYLEQVGSEDIIYAFVPMVRLGEALGIDLPVTRAMVEVMGVMLQRDYWAEGLDLAAIGLDGLDLEGVRRFVIDRAAVSADVARGDADRQGPDARRGRRGRARRRARRARGARPSRRWRGQLAGRPHLRARPAHLRPHDRPGCAEAHVAAARRRRVQLAADRREPRRPRAGRAARTWCGRPCSCSSTSTAGGSTCVRPALAERLAQALNAGETPPVRSAAARSAPPTWPRWRTSPPACSAAMCARRPARGSR